MKNNFFITTPIYYSNGVPHIGHAYSSLFADVISSYKRITGYDVKFSTGVDENSQKVVESAKAVGMEIMPYADMMAEKHREVWDGIEIRYTDFIRTTEPRHREFVQRVFMKSYENGDIYEGIYEGLYCVGCEAFKKESDLIDGKCPDHPNKPLEHLKEKNYFFRLSRYQERLETFYGNHPEFIVSKNRYAEMMTFIKGGLEDFSVSRETNKFGIPVPFDPTHVMYVWYDALFSYLTVCQGEEGKWWPGVSNPESKVLHVIGKDIARFHAIQWPAMLWSAGYEPPSEILITGHFTVDGQKMSKTIGNVIDPVKYVGDHSRDMLILYLFTAFPIGEDGDFSSEQAVLQYNAKLANNLGNLLSRFLTLALKLDGKINNKPGSGDTTARDILIEKRDIYIREYTKSIEKYELKDVLDMSFAFATELNQYVDTMKPWKVETNTAEGRGTLESVLYMVGSGLYTLAQGLMPFFEAKMRELLSRMARPFPGIQSFELPESFEVKEKGEPLYMRADIPT